MKSLIIASLLLASSIASAVQVCGDVAIDADNGIYRMVVTEPKTGEKSSMLLEAENPQVLTLIRTIQGMNDEYTQLMLCMNGEVKDEGKTFATPGDAIEFKIRPATR